jgi:hypothetical protein
MTVKYRKAFFSDLANINQLELIKDIEFITESANIAKNPLEVPGLKWQDIILMCWYILPHQVKSFY